MPRTRVDIHQVNISKLTVDPDIQRSLNHRRVDDMVENFKEDALGVITVSRRANGDMVIVDGQHRWAAAEKAGLTGLPAKVYEGLTTPEEASLFRVLNNTKIVNSLDRFRVRVVEGDPVAVAIHEALEREGWKVPRQPSTKSSGLVNSVASLEWVFNGAGIRDVQQMGILRQVIEVVTAAWGYDVDGMRANIVKGLGAFLTRFDGQVDLAKLVRMLKSYPGGPMKLQADGQLLRSMRRSSAADSVAAIVVNTYNRYKRANKLPEWFTSARIKTDVMVDDWVDDTKED